MAYTKNVTIMATIAACFVSYCFCVKKNMDSQDLLVSAIEKARSVEVFRLLENDSENSLGDEQFIKKLIVPFLSSEDPKVRGLASLFLFKKVFDFNTTFPADVFDEWKNSALNYKLKDIGRVDSPLCSALIRIMGDQSYGKKEDDAYGVALAIAESGTVSIPVQRKDLNEFYFIISGKGEVWLKDIKSGDEKVFELKPGVAVEIPSASIVQYRNTGKEKLIMLVPTSPPYNVIGKRTNWNIEKQFKKGKWEFKRPSDCS